MIWAEGFSLPLFQSAGNVAVRSNLANFGARGPGRRELHEDRIHEAVTRRTARGTAAGTADSATAAGRDRPIPAAGCRGRWGSRPVRLSGRAGRAVVPA